MDDLDELRRQLLELQERVSRLERGATAGVAVSDPRDQPDDMETVVGLTWLNRVGAVVVVVGLVLAVGWANEQGYLTPALRTGLLFAGSAIVLAAGLRGLRSDELRRRRFAMGVAIVGACGMYLAAYAAAHLDGLIAPLSAAAVCVVVTVGLALAGIALRSEPVAALAAIGGLAVPLVGNHGMAELAPLAAYLTILSVGLLALCRTFDWTALSAIGVAGAAVYYVGAQAPPLPVTAGLSLFAVVHVDRARRGLLDDVPSVLAISVTGFAVAASWLNADSVASAVAWGLVLAIAGLGVRGRWLVIVGVVAAALSAGVAGGALAQLSVSVACGLFLIGTGVRWRDKITRHAGIVALVFSLAKLLVIDVWSLGAGVRVSALLILGASLIAASFVYSRYQSTIERSSAP